MRGMVAQGILRPYQGTGSEEAVNRLVTGEGAQLRFRNTFISAER